MITVGIEFERSVVHNGTAYILLTSKAQRTLQDPAQKKTRTRGSSFRLNILLY